MTPDEFRRLDVGDIIRHESSHEAYIVTGNYGGRVTAVKTVDATNSTEWQLVSKVTQWGKVVRLPG